MANTPPVSGPGQFSQRSDLAPGQPVRVPTGLPYGEAKQLEQAQSAVPLPAGQSGAVAASPASQQGPRSPVQAAPTPEGLLQLLSHPTQRPNEPVNAPLVGGQPPVMDTHQILGYVEQLIHSTPVVPASVMRLYMNLRQEVMNGG